MPGSTAHRAWWASPGEPGRQGSWDAWGQLHEGSGGGCRSTPEANESVLKGWGQRKEEDWGQKPRGGPRSWEGRQVYLTLPRRLPQKQEAVRVAGERWAQPGEEQGAWGQVPRVLGCPLPRAVAARPGRPARGPAHQGQEPRPPPGAAPRAPRAPRCLVSVRDRIWPALRSTGSTLSCRPLSTAESLGSEKPSRCQDHAGK